MVKLSTKKDDASWYKDAVIYELHIKAFNDSNGDGIGDFQGLTEKLDYLHGLGITAIWLLPFYPSPLKDDGYDISNYFGIHPDYGTLKDFKEFLQEAHKRGLKVITELVINHTSNEHLWFQQSRRADKNSKIRQFYVWSDTPDRYEDARIIFKDFETSNWTWDPIAKSYYWHRFYSHQPDLNFDNPLLQKEIFRVIDFWFNLGVDGLRLDAVPYLFEREGTNCENLPESHAFLKKLRQHIDSKFKNRMLLAEANQWPEDASVYFGSGDECHMAFHFPLMPRMFMAIQMEDSFPIVDILNVTPGIPESCQWAIFLRNHDELTLEMVTDEERDYMYRVYAQDPKAKINLGIRRRLAPLLGNNRRKIELMNILLLSLPGTPVIYYGDEIGMGDNYYLGDRNGVRTPMQWSPDRNAGFSKANPQKLYLPIIIEPEYHYEAVNIENQDKNLSSPLWWIKRVIAMRKKNKAFSRGNLEILVSSNPKILTFIRCYQEEIILVVINLSRFSNVVELDLSKYESFIPQEVFSRNDFPTIGKGPYTLALGPYCHYWLLLKSRKEGVNLVNENYIPQYNVQGDWENILRSENIEILEQDILPVYLKKERWFGSKSKIIRKVKIVEDAVLNNNGSGFHLLLLEVSYNEGIPETYFLPLAYCLKENSATITQKFSNSIIAELIIDDITGVLYDGIYDYKFHKAVFVPLSSRKKIKGSAGSFSGFPSKRLKKIFDKNELSISSQPLNADQSNSSVIYDINGQKLMLKFYRRLDVGVNPELEILQNLNQNTNFKNIPLFLGTIQYERKNGALCTVALLEGFIEGAVDAWNYVSDITRSYFEHILSKKHDLKDVLIQEVSYADFDISKIPPIMRELLGGAFLEMVSLLGKRTAELHLALASLNNIEEFAPENFSLLYQKSVYKSMQGLTSKTMQLLRKKIGNIPPFGKKEAEFILQSEKDIFNCLQKILYKKISSTKIRIHGDYHLGQVLFTGKDFEIIDFEGEPTRSLSERRLKRSPFRDVAGMLRSFHYAAYAGLFLYTSMRKEDASLLESWIAPWDKYVSGVFLQAYLSAVGNADFIPKNKDEINILLQAFLLEKAVYELEYELNNRPDWVVIPLKGIASILSSK